ncbi:MAG: hypothetical protein KF814_00975 [Nitrospiraceae bacterium]|nr:hypothetical protein [Nitrospiraceae bacterium]
MIQKFIGLNACGARDIQREFGLPAKNQHPQNWSDRDRNLHHWGALNPELIQRALNLTDLHIRTACTVDYIRPDEVKVLASRFLRICPKCVKNGFHTPFHQLIFIPDCPLHQIPLLEVCGDCGKPTPQYSLSKQACSTPYGCAECGAVWWQQGRVGQLTATEQDARFLIMSEVGEWLTKRKEGQTIEAQISKLARFIPDTYEFQAYVRRLPERWADVLGVSVPHHRTEVRQADLHVTVEYMTRSDEGSNSSGLLDNKKYFEVYRAIRRAITKRVRKSHSECFEKMGRGIWFPVTTREVAIRQFCPEAYALLLWRMFWENIDVPQKLFSRQLVLFHREIDFVSDRHPTNLSDEAALRIFGLECLRTYRRCQEIGNLMCQREHIGFPLQSLNKDRAGEWVVKIPQIGNRQKLHWWWPRRWEKAPSIQGHKAA